MLGSLAPKLASIALPRKGPLIQRTDNIRVALGLKGLSEALSP